MTNGEKYFMALLKSGRIQVDTESGVVFSLASGKPKIAGSKHSAGYFHMSAGPSREKRFYILLHRLVWMAAHGEIPNGYEINHKNGNKRDNRIANLELVTRSENVLHAYNVLGKVFGLFDRDNSGENCATAKLTWLEVREIRKLYATGEHKQCELAHRFNVNYRSISNIVNRKSWRE